MKLFGRKPMAASPALKDCFVSLSVGNLLVLKACGFIEDHQARILDVSETSLRVRIGRRWYENLLSQTKTRKPLDVSLEISPFEQKTEADAQRFRRSPECYCTIAVCIRAASLSWTQSEFDMESKRLLWALRSYFMAC